MDSSTRIDEQVIDRHAQMPDHASTYGDASSRYVDSMNARFDLVSRLGRVNLWELAPEFGTVQSDAAFLRQLGLDPSQEITFTDWLARVHPADRPRVARHVDETLAAAALGRTDTPIERIEFRARSASGQWRWLTQSSLVVANTTGPPRLAAVIADVTEAMQDRHEREHAERLYRIVWDSIPGSAVALDADGTIVEANPAWYESAAERGGPRDAFVGRSYLEVARRAADEGEVSAARALDGLSRVLGHQSERFAMEYECHPPEHGPSRWYQMNAFALRRPSHGAIVFHWDITDRKLSDLSIQQARDALTDTHRLSTMSELATAIAHELNQPLATIMAAASTARRLVQGTPASELSDVVDDIMEATARAAEVMRRARGMIRRDRQGQEPVRLKEIVTAVSRLVASDLVINQVTLLLRLEDVPPVSGDRVQLQQVVLNLLLNAIDAVRAQPRGRRQVTVTIPQEIPGRVELIVADSGPGLREDVAARVFEPFTTTKSGGMGLGLTVVRAIIEAHGGRVEVESSTEGGAAFRVSLPCDYSRGFDATAPTSSHSSVAPGDRR